MKPLILINLKAYSEGTGLRGMNLLKKIIKVKRETNANFAIAAQTIDIEKYSGLGIPILAQHLDPVEPGSHTGFLAPRTVKEAGATGTILNHSEHKIRYDVLSETVKLCKKYGLKTIVCANDINEAKKIKKLNPDYIAIEPPELIGGETSIVDSRPELVKEIVKEISGKKVYRNILVGAGIKNKHDLEFSVKEGTGGVLLASHVAKANNPEQILRELADPDY